MPSFNTSPRIRSAPKTAILRRHLLDQGNRFGGDLGLVSMNLGLTPPIQVEELPMPPEQRLWLHDDEGGLSGTNQSGQQDEEHAIGPGEYRPFHLSPEHDELLA